ncbi:MAG: GNAT family N-acetyltransferase [Treponema sp.]|nr:GNAT family N-acetyltransferase [Treponema sp.]
MRFELDEALIDDIIFHMENQDGDFVLDIEERYVIDIHNNELDDDIDIEDENRFIGIPYWSSSDGYRLMERFAVIVKNPLLREELSFALNRNRGVFRAYRDVLAQHPEAEKQWYIFKEQAMKDEVLDWYNSLREEWGLEPIGTEPEDNTSLVQEDFDIKEDDDFLFTAKNAAGDFAGSISAALNGSVLQINKFEVKEEYRCMGIGKTLLSKLLEKADNQKLNVTIDLPAETDFFARSLLLENFQPSMQRFVRKN